MVRKGLLLGVAGLALAGCNPVPLLGKPEAVHWCADVLKDYYEFRADIRITDGYVEGLEYDQPGVLLEYRSEGRPALGGCHFRFEGDQVVLWRVEAGRTVLSPMDQRTISTLVNARRGRLTTDDF